MTFLLHDNYMYMYVKLLSLSIHAHWFTVNERGQAIDPYGTGGKCPPNIYEGGDVHGNIPPVYSLSLIHI